MSKFVPFCSPCFSDPVILRDLINKMSTAKKIYAQPSQSGGAALF